MGRIAFILFPIPMKQPVDIIMEEMSDKTLNPWCIISLKYTDEDDLFSLWFLSWPYGDQYQWKSIEYKDIEYFCLCDIDKIIGHPVRLDDVLLWGEKRWIDIWYWFWEIYRDRDGYNGWWFTKWKLGKDIYEQTPETQQQLADFITKNK